MDALFVNESKSEDRSEIKQDLGSLCLTSMDSKKSLWKQSVSDVKTVPSLQQPVLHPTASSALRGLISTKCDGNGPRPGAEGQKQHNSALKQNQTVGVWEVLAGQHLAKHRSCPPV